MVGKVETIAGKRGVSIALSAIAGRAGQGLPLPTSRRASRRGPRRRIRRENAPSHPPPLGREDVAESVETRTRSLLGAMIVVRPPTVLLAWIATALVQ
jgi:hypothetical protein